MHRFLTPRRLFLLLLPLLFVWAVRSAPLSEIGATLGSLNLSALLSLIVLNTIILALLSLRWGLILRAGGRRLPLRALLAYRLSAFGLSYFTPGPQFGGEPLQVYALKERHAMPAAQAISAVSLDKLVELLANFAFLVFGALVILSGDLFPGLSPQRLLPLSLALLALPSAYLLALWRGYRPLSRLISHLAQRGQLPSAICRHRPATYRAEAQAVRFFRQNPSAFWQALLLSVVIWTMMAFEYWLSLYFLGAQLPPAAAISALTAARLAFLLPLPGGLGALEASQVFVLQALGVSPALALSLALLIRARDISLGALGLWLAGWLTRQSAPAAALAPSQGGD